MPGQRPRRAIGRPARLTTLVLANGEDTSADAHQVGAPAAATQFGTPAPAETTQTPSATWLTKMTGH
ncbi:hypothetical protein K470DRAFT_255991 [Piedraia hortae CBS 480.64]|uniref:Uncharacterized protein n=1 Tax=Piedraia hortae CBS 480.64 TaxID=1314780 RepID=A0A6A7C6N7_9PEZI|nr:hypothetical protein K470DRAFT_255991 [Piedraia hortae CBS 480.64]